MRRLSRTQAGLALSLAAGLAVSSFAIGNLISGPALAGEVSLHGQGRGRAGQFRHLRQPESQSFGIRSPRGSQHTRPAQSELPEVCRHS